VSGDDWKSSNLDHGIGHVMDPSEMSLDTKPTTSTYSVLCTRVLLYPSSSSVVE
jgi:hypothetical protein